MKKKALENAKKKVAEEGYGGNVKLIHDCHSKFYEHLLEYYDDREMIEVGAATFNLGYLPGSDKSVVTRPTTTLAALDRAIAILKMGGILSCACYRAHEGGQEETEAVIDFVSSLPKSEITVTKHSVLNHPNTSPLLITIFRKK